MNLIIILLICLVLLFYFIFYFLLNEHLFFCSFIHIMTISLQQSEHVMQQFKLNCFRNYDTDDGFRHSLWIFREMNYGEILR
jgi:hypothetical protein